MKNICKENKNTTINLEKKGPKITLEIRQKGPWWDERLSLVTMCYQRLFYYEILGKKRCKKLQKIQGKITTSGVTPDTLRSLFGIFGFNDRDRSLLRELEEILTSP